MVKVIWALGIALLGFIAATGALQVWKQHAKITSARPVEVTVLSVNIEKHVSVRKGRRSTKYEPVIAYRYEAAGRQHTGRSVFPRRERGGLGWAKEIVSRFEAGSVHQGYYVPGDVGEAFLIRHYSFEPYLLILVPAAVLGVALFIGQFFWRRPLEAPVPRSDGRYEIMASKTIGTKVAFSLAIAGFWHGAALLALGHYFLVCGPDPSSEAIGFAWAYEAAGLIPLASGAYFQLVRRSVANAQVTINAAEPRLGDVIVVRAEQEAQRDLEVREVRVGLVCHETSKVRARGKTTISTKVCWQGWESAFQDRSAYRGDVLKAEVRLAPPSGGSTSTPPGEKGYPRYRWSIALQTKLAGSPDYRAEFPITIVGSPHLARVAQSS